MYNRVPSASEDGLNPVAMGALAGALVVGVVALKGVALMGLTAIAANYIDVLDGFSFFASVGIVLLGGIVTATADIRS